MSSAPHMLGNELNPESGAAARLQEQLSAELAAHAAAAPSADALVPPPLVNKAAPVSCALIDKLYKNTLVSVVGHPVAAKFLSAVRPWLIH